MNWTARSLAGFALIALAGCGGADGPESNAADLPGSNAAAAAAEAAPAQANEAAPAEARAYTLTADGIEPGLRFGMKQSDALAAAAAAFGPAGKIEHNDECGEGPMDFASVGRLQLGFQEGKLVGWSLYDAMPGLRTGSGLTIGSPRSALGDLAVEDSTLGPEFDDKGVGGLLDEKGEKVDALWAGFPCQFR